MKSLDTNLLFYSINTLAPEHQRSRVFVQSALADPSQWMVADQVWFELYRLLRNGVIVPRPLSALEADETIDWYRNRSGWSRCAWEPFLMDRLRSRWQKNDFPARRTFDLVLALSLQANGVTDFYTRNTRDFEGLGFTAVIDPLADPASFSVH